MRRIVFFLIICLLPAFGYTQLARQDMSGTFDSRYVNVKNDSDVWDYDSNGDIMPAANPAKDTWFELDSNNDIMPQEIFHEQDSNGDLQPLN